jgi:hypothetical protein
MKRPVNFVYLLILASVAFGQSDRGTITGTVSDPAGAVVPNAAVEAKNTQSGEAFKAGTSGTGNFTIAQLPVGTYELSVTSAGFKKFVRPGIEVGVAQTVRADATLEVGATTDTVTVSAEAPLLKTESGEMSHNVSYARVDEIPLLTLGNPGTLGNVRNPLQAVTLLPGAQFASENTLRINGMPSSSQAIRIEGQDATNGMWRQLNQGVQAGVDAIQEVAVQTSNFAAEYGQAGGGYFNYTMKSGTNQFHGSGYDYFNNEALNAGLPWTDAGTTNSAKAGQHIRNVVRRNDYGFTLGGPVWLPKIYNGHDKTFFFFNFEQFRENQQIRNGISTVPAPAYRTGDFSGALLGSIGLTDSAGHALLQNELFDPATTRPGPDGVNVRDPFTNNTIPISRMDPVALKVQSMLPQPLGSLASQAINNYAIPAYTTFRHTTIPSVKIDHSINSTTRISGYWQQTRTNSPNANGYDPTVFPWSAPEPTAMVNNTARINYDQTLKPTLLLHLGAGLFYTVSPAIPPSYDQTQLGSTFAPYYINQFPNFGGINDTVKGGTSLGLGNTFGVEYLKDVKPTANASLTWVKGNHTLKFGGEMVIEGFPQLNYTRANGQYGFGQNQTGDPWEFNKGTFAFTGFGYASFLLGLPNSLTVSQVTNSRIGNHSFGFYAQDTWKVTRRFTLDYGLRYDYATLLEEQYGRMQDASFSLPNPVAGNRPGTVIYGATCKCDLNHNYPYAFGPRIGAAYQINEKTVLRGGGGIAYSSSPNNAFLSYSVPDFYTFTSAAGSYTAVAPLQAGNPFAPGNPYGNAPIVWPDFSPHYPVSFGGLTPPQSPFISIDRNAGRLPRITQWSIGIQREIVRNLLVEANYVGNRGAWWTAPLLATYNYNALTPQGLLAERQYGDTGGIDITNATQRGLLSLPISNPQVIAKFPLLANPNNVYPGFPPNQPLNQALRPYPQWFGVPPFLGPPLGDTWYDSLQMKVTKRYSHGLDLQGAFTWQKELTNGANSDTSYLTPNPPLINDVFNYAQNKQISGFSRPLALVISGTYTTPGLRGTGTAEKVTSAFIRDWVIGTVLRYQSGALIRTPGSSNALLSQLDRGASNNPALWGGGTTLMNPVAGQSLTSVDPNCRCFDPTSTLILNPNAWQEVPAGQFGSGAPYYNDFRWQRQPAESISLGRTFRINHGDNFKGALNIRAEFQNIFNRTFLSAPSVGGPFNVNPLTATTRNTLGQLTGGYGYVNTVNGAGAQPRSGQLVARFTF